MAASIDLPTGTTLVAESGTRYRVWQRLGAGGNSVAFLVVASNGPQRGIPFAAKVFTKLHAEDRLARFRNEHLFLQSCSHSAVMRVFDIGIHAVALNNGDLTSFPFVVVEYLPMTLQVHMKGRLGMPERLVLTLQLLSALSFLAKQDPPVVHRDIKPANIFVKGRSCILGDFGLMRTTTQEPQHEADRKFYVESIDIGMPWGYRTPDLVAYSKGGPPPTPKSDVFQLGLVLAELFTGRNPHRRAKSLLDDVILDAIAPVESSHGALINSLIGRMVEMEAARRPTADEVLDHWEGLLATVFRQSLELNGWVF